MDISKVAAGILAGGRHTRMGADKLLLTFEGKTFLERMYEACGIFRGASLCALKTYLRSNARRI